MKRSQRMQPVHDIAGNREREAAQQFGDSRRELAAQEERLDDLQRYRGEYVARLDERMRAGIHVNTLQEYRLFLGQLDKAIVQQRNVVTRHARSCELHRLEWLARRTRSQAIGKVVERMQDQERRAADRHEQLENDEFATQMHRRNRPPKF